MENKDEQIGFHKGSLATLSKEHQELLRIVQITEELMKAHIKALKEQEKKQKTKLDERIG